MRDRLDNIITLDQGQAISVLEGTLGSVTPGESVVYLWDRNPSLNLTLKDWSCPPLL